MRVKFLTTVTIVSLIAFLIGTPQSQSQGPRGAGGGRPGGGGSGFNRGGFGGGNPGAFDPNGMFDMIANGGGTIKISEMRGRDRAAEWAQKNNITNGELTREQFAEYAKTWGSGGRSTDLGAAAPNAAEASKEKPGGGGRGWGGGGRGGDSTNFADRSFRQLDKNQDGFLEYDEMSENLKAEKDKWDADEDGRIDINEYREYIKAWQEKNRADRGDSAGRYQDNGPSEDRRGNLPPPGGDNDAPRIDLDKKVVVLRAGKLGDKMPAWFTEFDIDKDAQVALWEWKEKDGDLSEFRKWDLNGDGFITPDEVIRANAVASKESASSSSENRTASAGGAPKQGGGAGGAANFFAQMFGGRGQKGGAAGAPTQGGAGMGGGMGGRGMGGRGMGGSGMGGGGNSADAMFDRFAKDRSSFNISESGYYKSSLTAYAEKKGLSDGVITKEQFRDYWAEREAERAQGGGVGGGGGRGNRGGRSR